MGTISNIAERRGTTLFEPVFDLVTSWVVGVEALHPRDAPGGEVAAARAALNGLRSLPEGIFVAIALSPPRLGWIADLLDELPVGRIVVHLDEDEVEDPAALASRLARFRAGGGRVALDVGAGPAALRRIAVLQPDVIELDTSVTHGVDADRSRRGIAIGLVALGERIEARVEARGIATTGELAALRGMGVAYGRGPLLAPPFPLTELSPAPSPLDAA